MDDSFIVMFSFSTYVLSLVALSILYTLILVVNRLLLSPIRSFPGPKLAAATFWYEFYYDVIQRGQFEYHLAELHKEYGPIIRINPLEIHIEDPEFYDVVYNNGVLEGKKVKVDKHIWHSRQFGTEVAIFGTPGHDLHRSRRSVIAPSLSKRAVADLEPLIQSNVDQLMERVKQLAATKTPVCLFAVYAALTGDVISAYCFGRSLKLVERPDLGASWHTVIHAFAGTGHLAKQFSWLLPLMQSLPDRVTELMNPPYIEIIRMDRLSKGQINVISAQLKAGKGLEDSGVQRTILYDILTSDLPESEKAVDRLVGESNTLLIAGMATTTDTLATMSFYLLKNSAMLSKLRAELRSVPGILPGSRDHGSLLQKLEQLPYLTAVLKEGLRITSSVMQRLPRIFPDTNLVYRDRVIPRGVPVSLSSWPIQKDPSIFPEPHAFRPERWLTNEAGTERLDRFLIPFGRGTRQCVGLNLAWAEMYLALAAMFGSGEFELELFETTVRDVTVVRDNFIGGYPDDSKGVRVIVTA